MDIPVASTTLVTLLIVSARVLAWLSIAPPIATAGVPRTVRVMLSVGLSLAIVPSQLAHAPAAEVAPVAGALLEQVVIGAGLGFLTRLLFTAVESAGSLLDLFSGFSAAAAYDPMTSATNAIYAKFYSLIATTLLFVTSAHLMIFGGFLRTFDALPIDTSMSLSALDHQLSGAMTDLFVGALQIAGPLLVVLFIADISLGVLNRIAPQLNAFSMSFPIKIGLTLLLVGTGFMLMPQTVMSLGGKTGRLITAVTG